MARSAGSFAQVMAKEGEYVTLRLPSGEVRMVHKRCYATIGEVGNAEHENMVSGKAGRVALAGHPPDGARRGHEPGRPPARRRRRPHQRRPPPGDALGHADQGLQDAQEEAVGQLHRAAPQGQGLSKGRLGAHGAFDQEGALHPGSPFDEGRGHERPRREAGHQDLVAALDDRPRVPRAHDRRAQRQAVHAGLRAGEHGRAQAGGVRPDAHVPRAHQQEEVAEVSHDGGTRQQRITSGSRPARRGSWPT